MYVPVQFENTRVEALQSLIREHPLGTLVTLDAGGVNANHLPFLLEAGPAPLGTLRGHVARANPVWRDIRSGVESLVIFQGAQAYITPLWYATKARTGKVVPTYNYGVVHAYGVLRAIDDKAWVRGLVTRLTDAFEGGRASPWRVSDAPPDYIDDMLGAIVGIEVVVTRLVGKCKASQNRDANDREGVQEGLRAQGDVDARIMAEWIGTGGDV